MNELTKIHSLHIVSEKKFLPWIKKAFARPGWENEYIIFQYKKKNHFNPVAEKESEMSADKFGRDKAITIANRSDIVFHYFFDFPKADIVIRSRPEVQHYWNFFGAEIYQQTDYFRKELYGPFTAHLMKTLPEIKFRYEMRRLYYKWILRSDAPVDKLKKSLPRLNNILWYIEEEIAMIRKKIDLPPWLFFQFFTFHDIIPDVNARTQTDSRKILIGNSATIENNHMDILHLLENIRHFNHTVTLPMTYGQFRRYKSKLKQKYQDSLGNKARFLETHLNLQAYYQFLDEHATAIFMHYRQQGLGNIFYLLYNGTKIYLSKQNIIFNWLINKGIHVYSVEDSFKYDYEHCNLTLNSELANENRMQIRNLLDHNRNEETFRIIESKLEAIKTQRV